MLHDIPAWIVIVTGLMVGAIINLAGFNAQWVAEQWRRFFGRGGELLLPYHTAIDVNHEPPVTIVCAAMMHRTDFTVVLGLRHWDAWMVGQLPKEAEHGKYHGGDWEQGFLTSRGHFVDRREALDIAQRAGQINRYRPKSNPKDQLFSEDLY
jgi:hypothetical protein